MAMFTTNAPRETRFSTPTEEEAQTSRFADVSPLHKSTGRGEVGRSDFAETVPLMDTLSDISTISYSAGAGNKDVTEQGKQNLKQSLPKTLGMAASVAGGLTGVPVSPNIFQSNQKPTSQHGQPKEIGVSDQRATDPSMAASQGQEFQGGQSATPSGAYETEPYRTEDIPSSSSQGFETGGKTPGGVNTPLRVETKGGEDTGIRLHGSEYVFANDDSKKLKKAAKREKKKGDNPLADLVMNIFSKYDRKSKDKNSQDGGKVYAEEGVKMMSRSKAEERKSNEGMFDLSNLSFDPNSMTFKGIKEVNSGKEVKDIPFEQMVKIAVRWDSMQENDINNISPKDILQSAPKKSKISSIYSDGGKVGAKEVSEAAGEYIVELESEQGQKEPYYQMPSGGYTKGIPKVVEKVRGTYSEDAPVLETKEISGKKVDVIPMKSVLGRNQGEVTETVYEDAEDFKSDYLNFYGEEYKGKSE